MPRRILPIKNLQTKNTAIVKIVVTIAENRGTTIDSILLDSKSGKMVEKKDTKYS
jgi:hypothetical protein